MRIVTTVAILCVATAPGPRGALAQSKLTFVGTEPAAASAAATNQPQPRVYHFHVTAKNAPQASLPAAQAASFEQTEPLPWRAGEEGLTQGGTPPTLDVDDASALLLPGVTYTAPPVWETVPSWGFHSFAHTSCTCPTYGDNPWQGYCAQRRRRYRPSCQREQCRCAECRRCDCGRCSPATPFLGKMNGDQSVIVRDGVLRAPAADAVPGPRRLPKNELPTPADESGRGRD